MLRKALARYRNALVVIGVSVLTVFITVQLLSPSPAPNLAKLNNASRVLTLNQSWAHGDVIALVRHVERCDRTNAACLGPQDGVTVLGETVAQGLGNEFRQLGLKDVDIYSSDLTRARQTAEAMFARTVEAHSWIFNCRGTMLRDVLKHKVPGRNLVLVTHSECMDDLEAGMNVPTDTTFGYGASLFIKADGTSAQPQMLGYIETKDWGSIVPHTALPVSHGFEASRL
ncbi:histidine phosphatase family protein [Pseudomonas sp. CCC3.1]|uniref:lipopolysaccharide core heptose(II)-phosphate phosphatase PmrG n=1 Tax=Pseudomonas sp. CCC3.1 TaxID=3048607 RepID=UPI002AC8F0F2|nr:histidine phosphatase family protein [Pseudomonas sp. CCC3.1]MEB0207391.1 histidine phosphatase family protein [Pseudomonas sp. CCC3.1]WPX35493.1 histidine phosphatase family protein [Pseudomonas sp. CCC3.1]